MGFTAFTPQFRSQESQDAQSFKIWDESTWTGESGNCSAADVVVTYYDADNNATAFDSYPLIDGVDRTKFDEYLSTDGHEIELSDILPTELDWERFIDGYYEVKITYDTELDGGYVEGSEPYYVDTEAFLALMRCKSRKLPSLITWPDIDYDTNRDIFLIHMYLNAAEDAADLALKTRFLTIIGLLNAMFDNYEIIDCW